MSVPTQVSTRPGAAAAAVASAQSAPLDPADEQRLVRDQLLGGVIDETPRTLILGLLAALSLAVASTWDLPDNESGQQHQRRVWAWLALIVLVLAHGWLTSRARSRQRPGESLPSALARHYTWGAQACAVLWGAAGWVLIPAPSAWAAVVVLVGMSMVLLGAAAAMAGCRPLVTIHVGLIALVFCSGLLRTLEPAYLVCGLGFVLLAATAIASAHRQEAALSSAITGRLRIAALLERLQREQTHSEAARQEAVAAREEVERAHAAKTVFMAAASHDLRQPMHALTQYLAAITRLNADPRLAASIDGANQAVEAMGKLLQAVLEISKLQSGAVTPQPDVFALDDWSARRLGDFEPLAAAKGLALDVHVQRQLLVCTDRALLDRVLANLLHNAISYTDEGRVVVRISRRGQQVRIRVADTGGGIAPAERQRVFEPFYQLANPGRNRQLGLGLGLAIVREHVKLLGLQLRLTTRVGRGSVFTVTLPISPDRRRFARASMAGESVAMWNHVADALIVLIDDDDMSLRATEATLIGFGCRVVTGHDADEAIAGLRGRAHGPQFIVSDYRLADATGLEAVDRLLSHCASAFGPALKPAVLIVSGETRPEELAKVHAAGAQMLHKPVRPAVLFERLNALLQQRVPAHRRSSHEHLSRQTEDTTDARRL